MITAHDFYENEYARFWIADSILRFEYKENTTLDLKVAQQVVTDRIHFQNELSFPVLCDVRGVISTEKAGRDYLAQTGSILTTAVALLVQEEVLQMIGMFYMQINKPTVPTKVFTKEADALNFLMKFV
ncbi:hypothetical protein B6A10_06190 [Flavobacterium sp. L1I52]|uniref:DUF7793 domain-containing protein n=1 Tax=Flavobacterium pokkalii TaxID=1940408 RepID=A0ABR7UQ01_9FLAO|nr:hypothetical protein [Flavobacterium pokkalii]MBD0724764.1 hypothetical protein [Flavobacterium pokkalii]